MRTRKIVFVLISVLLSWAVSTLWLLPVSTDVSARETKVISPESAISLAINNVKKTQEGYSLKHPNHTASFTSNGLEYASHSVPVGAQGTYVCWHGA